ncbi:E3 ubiquitin-protein ligase Praja-2 isoform X1 [Electrophorus electricus]|nr:E3 ubiquitin-protein ligase Praja-2 isoform X1 [Electrophorus electricus]XP_026857922.1 E3 ubiquitin-protein ligase Praja-2 isoform X1 [Electrophorus electricus]
MGQGAGKPSWAKPSGGYQTITGRRYGRRHAYISFRPSAHKHRPMSAVDCQEMEIRSVHVEHTSAPAVLQGVFPVLSSSLGNSDQDGQDRHKSSSDRVLDKCNYTVPFDIGHNTGDEKSAEACAWADGVDQKTSSLSILNFMNIDSYEPNSNGGEAGGTGTDQSCTIQKSLDMISDLGKDFDHLSSSHSYLHTESCKMSDCLAQERNSNGSLDTNQAHTLSWRTGKTCESHGLMDKVQSDACNTSTASSSPCSCVDLEHTTVKEAVKLEMVVRPKVRKQTSESNLNKRKNSQTEEASWVSSANSVTSMCGSAPPFYVTQKNADTSQFLFNFLPNECMEFGTLDKKHQMKQNSRARVDDDNDFWEDLEEFVEKNASPEKKNESLECSEGEWSASWTSDTGLEKERRSSEESWETLPGLDELPSSSNSLEDVPPLSLTQEEQSPLEEGEIPWLMCNEDSASSSDEEPDNVSQFVHPGLFILDSSNNLDDDSSMSEDLDTEWRLLDDFGESVGMAQSISYVDHSQLLTYMALEERLAQAMEAALAHLESLAIDVEQAHPPASEHIIDCLPQITVLDDHSRQEQCCAICCCEYVTEEVATQLPCHHMFHKICVTLWLRKSGTCPVCRHVLTPPPSDPTSFLSDQENATSSQSVAGQTR